MDFGLIKVSALQYKVKRHDKDFNLKRTLEMVKLASEESPHFVLLPNYFMQTGLETIPGELTGLLSDLAKDNDMYVIGGVAEDTGKEKGYNSTFLINPVGQVKRLQSKVHMIEMEKKKLQGSSEFNVERTKYATVGSVMCGDIFYPEVSRCVALLGAEIIFVPSIMGGLTLNALDFLCRARAIENQCYVINANAIPFEISEEKPNLQWGGSGFYSPFLDGICIKRADNREGVLSVMLDMEDLAELRDTKGVTGSTHGDLASIRGSNLFFSRRPEDYGLITDRDIQKRWDNNGRDKALHKPGKHYCEIKF
jgi:predicted amidohydrolase